MSLIYESSVYQESYDLLKKVHIARRSFDKGEKYALGGNLEESLMDVLLFIVEAGQTRREFKVLALDKSRLALEKAKILIRLALDLDQISKEKYISFQGSLQKIGRMLWGWRKSV